MKEPYTRVPNNILDLTAILPYFTTADLRILNIILRYTYGYHRTFAYVGLKMLSKKTCLSRRHILKTIRHLKDARVIVVTKAGKRNIIAMNTNYREWFFVDKAASDDSGKHLEGGGASTFQMTS